MRGRSSCNWIAIWRAEVTEVMQQANLNPCFFLKFADSAGIQVLVFFKKATR